MRRSTYALGVTAMAVGLVVSGCSSSDTADKATEGTTATSSQPAASPTSSAATTTSPVDRSQLPSLIPTPAASQETKGPEDIADNGIHMHFRVDGAPVEVMNAYKSALEDDGWAVTTIVTSGGEGGGGATYTGTHGDAFGVFDGGGFDSTTFVDVCTWPSKPAEPNCSRGER
ncbi:hypothetical protein [Mycolicibacterium holsaticum]|uniref:Uncharacterized protein n=1 Tax=Mycolicibacterium holsaticum TaxID=152142 RepID=A0A1E3S376_9MYCO|nr:hypothetical protein [Mycolicibacterium holsaticum]ODQ96623.1 hypothetical protein BHQ17_00170 [Mycolicibacterium holsaticum]